MIEAQAILGPNNGFRGSEPTTRVAFFTETHRIVADVDTGPRRLVEVLRDVTRAYLDLKGMNVACLADPTETVATSARGVLQKSDIRLAAIRSEANRPERRLYGYVARATVRILAIMTGCEIVGQMHLPEGTQGGIIGYLQLRDAFIHIGEATVSGSLSSAQPSTLSTVILNRVSLQLLCLAD